MHHLPRLCGSNKSLPSSLNPSHPKTTSRAFVPRRRTTSAVAPMTYAQHTRPYERIPERQSSWGGGLPAGVNPPTASPSINTCLMHTDRSDGMPTTKEALTSACCSQHRIICCCLRCFFALEMLELLRAVRPDRLSSATRQCGLSAASSAQRPPAREPRQPICSDRARPIGREVLRPPEVRSEPQRPFLVPQRVNVGSHSVPYT